MRGSQLITHESSTVPRPLTEHPTAWQQKTIWSALTSLSVVCIGAVFVGVIWLLFTVVRFLQPILIPFAVAGVMAYLLDPVVSRIVRWGTSRQRAVWAVFVAVTLLLAGIVLWIVPALSEQTVNLAKRVPGYTRAARHMVVDFADDMRVKYGLRLLPSPDLLGDPNGAKPDPLAMKSASAIEPTEIA